MNIRLLMAVLAALAMQVEASVPDIVEGFESYAAGTNFYDAAVAGWRASSRSVLVTNAGGYSGQAVVMGGQSALSNAIGGGVGAAVVWTEVMIKPTMGDAPPSPPTNSASFGCYFNSNGYVVVYSSAAGSQVCTNDVWGHVVDPATNGYMRVTVWQDFGQLKEAVFLNGQLLVQDMPFVGSASDYKTLLVNNPDNSAWLDDVWVRATRNATVLTNDYNGDGWADSRELADYGYVARTLYVGGEGYPRFDTIQAAVDVARPRDTIFVYAGAYAETVTIVGNVAFGGAAFSLSGLVVDPGAVVLFPQPVSVDTANVNGAVVFANGATCSVSSALSVGDTGLLNFESNSTFTADYAGVTMNGAFVISNTWSTAATRSLTFSDNFENYNDGTELRNLAFEGWDADSDQVIIKALEGRDNSKGAKLPWCTVLSNRIDRAGTNKIWTDFWIAPMPGVMPGHLPTNSASFAAYVNEEGYLVVFTNGGFNVCSNAWDGEALAPMTTNAFTRVTIFQNMTTARYAVFVGGRLVVEQASFPGGSDYHSLRVDNREGSTVLDEVLVTPDVPAGLPYGEAMAIARYGSIMVQGSIYLMR